MCLKLKKNINSPLLFYIVMLLVLTALFFGVGEKGYLMWKDSPAYLACDGRVGIMPVYPLFLQWNEFVFGEKNYLYAIVIEQGIFSVLCVVLFLEFIRKQFRVSYLKMYPVLFLAICMPFTVNLPLSVSSHDIMTEALAYPFFYIYMICFIKTICDKKYGMVAVTLICSSLLAMLRTQLQLASVLSASAFFYVAWMRGRHLKLLKQLLRGGVLVCLAAGVTAAGMMLTMGLNILGQKGIAAANQSEEAFMEVQEETQNRNMTEQYGHLLIDKAVYEIDEDDYLLFSEKEMQKLCKAVYRAAEESGVRHSYIREDLWAWQDIMDGIASGTAIAAQGWAYYVEENPDSSLSSSAINEIAAVLFREHLGRIILHTLQMIPNGLLCTVFFRKDSLYLMCLFITFLVYISAFGMVVWGYRRTDISNMYSEFLLGCLVVNILFVVILAILFFAMQRYLIYCFGIFWVAYYLMAVKLLEIYVWKKRNK